MRGWGSQGEIGYFFDMIAAGVRTVMLHGGRRLNLVKFMIPFIAHWNVRISIDTLGKGTC